MSYYYTYYLGYEDKDGKVYPLGPYDYYKHLCPVICRSRSFASKLYNRFSAIEKDKASEELKKEFPYEFEDEDKDSKFCSIKKIDLENLPKKSFIKKGYYLIQDVKRYENYLESDDVNAELPDGLFFETITPTVYANMLTSELLLNQGQQIISVVGDKEEGEEEPEYVEPQHSAGDYMFYAFPDVSSEEYEAYILKEAAMSFDRYDGKKIVVLLIEG